MQFDGKEFIYIGSHPKSEADGIAENLCKAGYEVRMKKLVVDGPDIISLFTRLEKKG